MQDTLHVLFARISGMEHGSGKVLSLVSSAVNSHMGWTCQKLCGCVTLTMFRMSLNKPPSLSVANFHNITLSMFVDMVSGQKELLG